MGSKSDLHSFRGQCAGIMPDSAESWLHGWFEEIGGVRRVRGLVLYSDWDAIMESCALSGVWHPGLASQTVFTYGFTYGSFTNPRDPPTHSSQYLFFF